MNSKLTNIIPFSMEQVINLDKYCVNALEKDVDYLLTFDADRLLAGFRETAGIDMRGAKRYEGWETTLIGGHTIGHYLSAIAQAYVNPGVCEEDKEALYKMITSLIDGLLECQINSKSSENFLFGAVIIDPANLEKQFDNIEKDLTNIITEAWVPWYTLHKILAGVLDVYKLTGYDNALSVAKRIGDWSYNRAMGWDAATAAQVIRVEYGGMNEVLYELYSLTGEEKYAVVAHYFDSVALYERVSSLGTNALNNLHANTTIPKFIGALHRYCTCHNKVINGELVDASAYLDYAVKFWDMVVEKHTYVTGGNSEWEHFGKDYILDKERTNCNCETCNIYNMLKYSRTLFCLTGDVKYADYYENAFYNTILSSQNPETGMTTYFQPMSTGYFKVFGRRFDKFWCCSGTGMENFTKLNDSIFFHNDRYVIVNLYECSKLTWDEKGVSVTVGANLQSSDTVKLLVETSDGSDSKVGIALRIPSWVARKPKLTINGINVEGTDAFHIETEKGYVLINEGLENGSEIILTLPMQVVACPLPDNLRSVAFKYGPTVLSADLGTENMVTTMTGVIVTIPASKVSGFDDIVLPEGILPDEFINNPGKYMIRDNETEELGFTLSINNLRFAPHFKRYKERYGIYFVIRTREEMIEAKKAREQSLLEKPEGVVIDTVQPGYGQYENDELHRLSDWGGSVGSTENGTTRYAKAGGSFTYFMKVSNEDNNYLSLTFLKEDNGKTIKVMSRDEVIYEDVLDYNGEEESYEIRVKVTKAALDQAEIITANGEEHRVIPVTFRGLEGAQSARLFEFIYMMNY